jgi:hypothetical protein
MTWGNFLQRRTNEQYFTVAANSYVILTVTCNRPVSVSITDAAIHSPKTAIFSSIYIKYHTLIIVQLAAYTFELYSSAHYVT